MLGEDKLKEIADYCRVDADDAQLTGFVGAAMEYMEDAGVREPVSGSPRFARWLQCVKYLVLDLYDRRDASVEGSLTPNPAFRRMLNQLKLSEPGSESGT